MAGIIEDGSGEEADSLDTPLFITPETIALVGEPNELPTSLTPKVKSEEDIYKPIRDKNAHEQQESLKKIFHTLASVVLFTLGWSVVILILVRLIILISPTECHWLSETQIEKIDQLFNYIIVGSVGSSVFGYFKKNIKLD